MNGKIKEFYLLNQANSFNRFNDKSDNFYYAFISILYQLKLMAQMRVTN